MKKFILFIILSLMVFSSAGHAEMVDNKDGTMTDTKTGLMWQKPEAVTMNWKSAIAYCQSLVLAGHSDWRLPERNELETLLNSSYDIPAVNYWSSTINADAPDYAWSVSFFDNNVYANDKNGNRNVLAVRGGQ